MKIILTIVQDIALFFDFVINCITNVETKLADLSRIVELLIYFRIPEFYYRFLV